MMIGGLHKTSLIDYPGKICAIVFTQGCNFRCPYCHNPELVEPELFQNPIEAEEILFFLKTRIKKLDAVEITGGEPTLQKDLMKFITAIKNMGFLVKLDTNGSNPKIIKKLLNENLIDYIAMDIKAPLKKYTAVTGIKVNINKIKESIYLIKNSEINYEFRTTIVKPLLTKEDLIEISKLIKGADLYVLQKFISSKTLDPDFLTKETYSDKELYIIKRRIEKQVKKCLIC